MWRVGGGAMRCLALMRRTNRSAWRGSKISLPSAVAHRPVPCWGAHVGVLTTQCATCVCVCGIVCKVRFRTEVLVYVQQRIILRRLLIAQSRCVGRSNYHSTQLALHTAFGPILNATLTDRMAQSPPAYGHTRIHLIHSIQFSCPCPGC